MSSAITVAGQTRINQLRGEEKPLVIDRMVLALVPGLDPTQPVDRNQQMPDPAHIVHTYQIPSEFKGYVNPDQVVYSMILGSNVGDFSFNWIGTVEAVTGNVISVTTIPETPKRKTNLATNTTGNNITRNVMMQFQDAQALTGVSISAETWQFDYTTWMTAKISEHDQDEGAHRLIFDRMIGKIDYFDSEVPPVGWLEANGSECPEAAIALNTLLAGRHGLGANGRSLLPDLRGEFVRGWDHGRGVDVNRCLGNLQDYAVEYHNHKLPTGSGANGDGTWGVSDAYWEEVSTADKNFAPAGGEVAVTFDDGISIDRSRGGNYATETRPRNITMLACVYAGI